MESLETSETPESACGFAPLGLLPALVKAAADAGWTTVTAIQALAVPAILQGRDLLATAPTGSGKTATFALQALLAEPQALARRPRCLHALVLALTGRGSCGADLYVAAARDRRRGLDGWIPATCRWVSP